jgi:hypothetical protein
MPNFYFVPESAAAHPQIFEIMKGFENVASEADLYIKTIDGYLKPDPEAGKESYGPLREEYVGKKGQAQDALDTLKNQFPSLAMLLAANPDQIYVTDFQDYQIAKEAQASLQRRSDPSHPGFGETYEDDLAISRFRRKQISLKDYLKLSPGDREEKFPHPYLTPWRP